MIKRVLATAAAAGLALTLAACGSSSTGSGSASGSSAPQARTLTVLAASSLTGTFNALKAQFQTDNPGVTVTISYGGSSDLAQQIVNGSPADLFAAASDATMKTVTDAGLTAGSPTIFATRPISVSISCIVAPASLTRPAPLSTRAVDSAISAPISFAAAAERCARLRTSPATTAKPRPSSPARAASTAAFSARILVWNAMPSIAVMMPVIFDDPA